MSAYGAVSEVRVLPAAPPQGKGRVSAALVIAAHLTGKADAVTAFCAASFFWIRLAHAVVYLAAIPYIRTVLFTLGFVAVAGIFWEIIR
jgi:uncharacterized MAPEG superfamily protein